MRTWTMRRRYRRPTASTATRCASCRRPYRRSATGSRRWRPRMAETYDERLEQVEQLQMLLQLSREVAALDSLDAVLETLVEAAKRELAAEAGSLFLHDDETGELYTVKTTDLGSRQIRVLDHLGIVGAVYQSGVGEIV